MVKSEAIYLNLKQIQDGGGCIKLAVIYHIDGALADGAVIVKGKGTRKAMGRYWPVMPYFFIFR
jgi:hypothetical protein